MDMADKINKLSKRNIKQQIKKNTQNKQESKNMKKQQPLHHGEVACAR